MAEIPSVSFPMTPPPEQTLTQGTFELGVITLIEQSNLPPNALAAASNIMLYEKGAPGPRWGTNWYGTSPALPTPSQPNVALASGSNLGLGAYQYQVTFVNALGETTGGTNASITTTSGNQAVNLSNIPIGASGVTARRIYRTKVGGSTYYLVTTIADNRTTVYSDTTADASLPATTIPTVNTATAVIDGGGMYTSALGVNHLMMACGGNIFRSTTNGTSWQLCTGATYTIGKKVYFCQGSSDGSGNNYMYITNGYDYPIRYNGSLSLVPFIAISPPNTPTVTATGLPTGSYQYFYRVDAVNAVGFTQASASGTITTSTSRESWDPTNTGTHYQTISWPAVTGAVRYDIFLAEDAADDAANNDYYLDSIGATSSATQSYVDNGQTATDPNSTAPVTNTTGGPRVREFVLIDSRMWGTQDRDYPYRAWWSGSGPFVGYFSDSYDGGYIDLQIGSQYLPNKVVDYRDGKGDPLTTVFCNSADSTGCIWQISLSATTLLNTQFTQPTANKLSGSRGTPAPNSVVAVDNDFMFFNYQAIFDLGSRQSLFNLLSSDEYSANIRNTLVNNINPSAAAGVAAEFYLAKVFISVPYNSTGANTGTIVYDTERKAFLPNAYTFGMERLFHWTDNSGTNHLMFWKTGDTGFSETSSSIYGDYGQPFQTNLLTGLIPTQKSRFDFMYVDTAYVEFSGQVGTINIQLLGVDRTNGYVVQKSAAMTTSANAPTNVGWDIFAWDTDYWDDSSASVQVYSESTSKRYFIVNKELNAYQFNITTNSNPSAYVLRTLQVSGTATDAGMPHTWRLNAF